jgi:GNAT superfamily N-acetyltransferase
VIVASESEGRRFGLRAGRIEATRIDADALQREVVEGGWDWLVLRLPTGEEACVERLRARGLEPQSVDTLMTWAIDLPQALLPAAGTGIVLRDATSADADAIGALVRSVFARYPNHYTANPWLDPALALEGYVEWALSHVGDPSRSCQLACVDGEIAGLSCSRHDPGGGPAIGVLHGVDPRFGGRGVYRAMIEDSLRRYRDAGHREFRISTQAGNHTVQNLWARLGLRLVATQFTVHLMPMLGRALAAPPEPVDAPDGWSPAFPIHDDAPGRGEILRRSEYFVGGRARAPATQRRRAQWRGSHAGLREVEVRSDDTGRVLGWIHFERAPVAPDTSR